MASRGLDLQHRPGPEELSARGILLNDQMAPALHGKARELKKNMATDKLAKALRERPELGELQQHHILLSPASPGGLAPSLASAAASLEHQMTSDKLAKHLRERPTVDKLERDGIMSPSVA